MPHVDDCGMAEIFISEDQAKFIKIALNEAGLADNDVGKNIIWTMDSAIKAFEKKKKLDQETKLGPLEVLPVELTKVQTGST